MDALRVPESNLLRERPSPEALVLAVRELQHSSPALVPNPREGHAVLEEMASDAAPEIASTEDNAAINKRKMRSPTGRALMVQAHFKFKQLLKYKMKRTGGRVVDCEEEYTFSTPCDQNRPGRSSCISMRQLSCCCRPRCECCEEHSSQERQFAQLAVFLYR
ncbi:hypothetical protein DVH05_003465 [Phytophthora capsici]|nr:hypothetical protein DVH05_003465 [Phytophthora capsici]